MGSTLKISAVDRIRNPLLSIAVFLLAFLSSCSETKSIIVTQDWQTISPVLREMYDHLGGSEVLGPAISLPTEEGGRTSQYTRAAKLEFDQTRPVNTRFRLLPIGVELGYVESPKPPFDFHNESLCSAHQVAPMFLAMYEKLGKEFIGCPISELRFNPSRNRFEQYFENLGLYRLKGTDSVHTLDWGWIACGDPCLNSPLKKDTVYSIANPGYVDLQYHLHPVFKEFANRLGTDLTGFPLSDPHINKDGRFDQVMERVVLSASSPDSPETVTLRSLSKEFHIPVANPRPFRQAPGFYLYKTFNELGYEIPEEVWVYILDHGGVEVIGAPITHLTVEEDQLFSQCFVNLCLYYDLTETGMPRVYPMSLGYIYNSFVPPPKNPAPGDLLETPETKERLTLNVWASMPSVKTNQQQEIGVIASRNGNPEAGVTPILIIFLPDGRHLKISMSPTGDDGRTGVRLPTLDAASGSIINYEICVETESNKLYCNGNSFVIWDNP